MHVEMVDPLGQALREIGDPAMKRDDIAVTYAFAIRQWDAMDKRYATINHAIMERWSLAGLKYIKERAWRIAQGKVQP